MFKNFENRKEGDKVRTKLEIEEQLWEEIILGSSLSEVLVNSLKDIYKEPIRSSRKYLMKSGIWLDVC